MNKLLIGILGGIITIILLLIYLIQVVQGPPEKLGARPDSTFVRLASTTINGLGTYFGDEGGTGVGGRRTPTTTLLTVASIQRYDSVTIDAVSVSTTTSSGGTVYLQPEVSEDAATWIPVPVGLVTNTGTFGKDIALNAGNASTTFTWAPNVTGTGTSTTLLPPLKDLGGYFRVRVSSTGTSTISVGVRLLSQ